MACDADQIRVRLVDSALQLRAEEQVCELALAVGVPLAIAVLPAEIIEANRAHAMRSAADRDHARAFGCQQQVEEQAGQREMAEVIRSHLHLETIRGAPI